MLGASFVYGEQEQNSVGAQLLSLYAIPARVFDLPVVTDGTVTAVKVKMRLLGDKENEEISELSDRFGPTSRIIMQRRAILSRAIEWVESVPITMPTMLIQAIEERTGAKPTKVDQNLWVFEQSQSPVLEVLMEFYEELLDEQKVAVDEIKKKFEQLTEASRAGTNSFE